MSFNATTTEHKVTRSEIFAGIALILSAASLIFTAGIIYGDVQRNTKDIYEIKHKDIYEINKKVDPALLDIAGMKSDIKFLVTSEERRQERMGITNTQRVDK